MFIIYKRVAHISYRSTGSIVKTSIKLYIYVLRYRFKFLKDLIPSWNCLKGLVRKALRAWINKVWWITEWSLDKFILKVTDSYISYLFAGRSPFNKIKTYSTILQQGGANPRVHNCTGPTETNSLYNDRERADLRVSNGTRQNFILSR